MFSCIVNLQLAVACDKNKNDQIGIIDLKNSISLMENYKSIFYSLMFNFLACKIIKKRKIRYIVLQHLILLRGFAMVVRTSSLPFCSNKGHRVKDGLELQHLESFVFTRRIMKAKKRYNTIKDESMVRSRTKLF